MVQPNKEYVGLFWSPYLTKDSCRLGKDAEKGKKIIKGLEHPVSEETIRFDLGKKENLHVIEHD